MDNNKKELKQTLSVQNNKVLIKNKSKIKFNFTWPIKVLVLTFCFSIGFSIFSQIINSKVGVVISIFIIFIFLFVGVVFDIIGVASTVCEKSVFLSLAQKGDKTARICYRIVCNSEKVSSFCCDIIGDICGVLSGSAGASLLSKINFSLSGTAEILVLTVISAIIASLTVFFKALGKTLAIEKSHSIIYRVCKVLSIFIRRKRGDREKK